MIIETSRLVLRPFLPNDAKDIYDYLKEPEVNCFKSMKLASVKEAEIEAVRRSEEKNYYFAIVLKETNKVIGEISAFPEHSDEHDKTSPLDTFNAK